MDDYTAACSHCGHTIYRSGNIWPHADGLLMCAAMWSK